VKENRNNRTNRRRTREGKWTRRGESGMGEDRKGIIHVEQTK
jgi:hypothetical protein